MDGDVLKMAQILDKTCLALALVLPVLAVLRWNLWGVVLGTLVFWGSLLVAGPLLSALDPKRLRGGTAMLDFLWLIFGWFPGVIYCFIIYGMKRLFLLVHVHRQRTY